MKTYQLSFLIETESDTQYKDVEVFTDLETAIKEYKKAVKNAYRGRQSNEDDFKEYLTESIVLELRLNGDFEETLMQQVIYSEGVIDRINYKGAYAVNFYSRATFNGKELMHIMYFQGEKQMWGRQHKVPQSKIEEWYYKTA